MSDATDETQLVTSFVRLRPSEILQLGGLGLLEREPKYRPFTLVAKADFRAHLLVFRWGDERVFEAWTQWTQRLMSLIEVWPDARKTALAMPILALLPHYGILMDYAGLGAKTSPVVAWSDPIVEIEAHLARLTSFTNLFSVAVGPDIEYATIKIARFQWG